TVLAGARLTGGSGSDAGPSAPPSAAPAAAAATTEGGGAGLTVQGLPLIKRPHSRITAIDLDKGEFRWQVPFGSTPDNIRNHPALKGLNLPPLGRQGNNSGTLGRKTALA